MTSYIKIFIVIFHKFLGLSPDEHLLKNSVQHFHREQPVGVSCVKLSYAKVSISDLEYVRSAAIVGCI
jgi:hypothetical protein